MVAVVRTSLERRSDPGPTKAYAARLHGRQRPERPRRDIWGRMVLVSMPSPLQEQGHTIQGDICGTPSYFTWGLSWEGHHVVFHVDNSAIVANIGSGSSRNPQVANVLRMIVMLAARLGFFYSCSWVSSSNNQIAD